MLSKLTLMSDLSVTTNAIKKGRYIPVVPYTLMQISQIIKENNLNN